MDPYSGTSGKNQMVSVANILRVKEKKKLYFFPHKKKKKSHVCAPALTT